MRLIKMFGLTALAAVAAMAFIGASSASANGPTALCKIHQEPCAEANQVKSVHMVNVGGTVLHASIPFIGAILITCSGSLGTGTVLALANPQVGHLTALTWTNCVRSNGETCTVNTTALGLLEVLRTALNLGTVKTNGTTVQISGCGLPTCSYNGNVSLGTIEGALHTASTGHGRIIANATVNSTGGFCPSTASWLATYETLEHVYVMT